MLGLDNLIKKCFFLVVKHFAVLDQIMRQLLNLYMITLGMGVNAVFKPE